VGTGSLKTRASAGRREQPPARTLQGLGGEQRCHYRGMTCAGCGLCFEHGERVRSAGDGLAHLRCSCVEAAQRGEQRRARTAGRQEPTDGEANVSSADQQMDDARAYATWAQLERDFATGGERREQRLLLPRHSRERFIQMLRWMAQDDVRCELLCRRCGELWVHTMVRQGLRTGRWTAGWWHALRL